MHAFSADSFSLQTVETKNQDFGRTLGSENKKLKINFWVSSSQIKKVAEAAKLSSILFAPKMRASVRTVARVDARIVWFSIVECDNDADDFGKPEVTTILRYA